MIRKIQLTKDGFEKIQQEHNDLIEKKKNKALDRLQKARAMGDLSENSEYQSAKEELALVEERISELEGILKNAEIVKHNNHSQVIEIGSQVIVEIDSEKEEFTLVGEFEADPLNKKLSSTSPIGKALLSKRAGETVEVKTPAGKTVYKILKVK